MTDDILPVSKASAHLLLVQCIGTYSGHMSDIAFNPTLQAIAQAHGVHTAQWHDDQVKRDFAKFLRMVAEQLDPSSSSRWD